MKTIALASPILSAYSDGSLYRPEHRERLTPDNAAAILRRMPGVRVSTTGPRNAKHTIIHLADYHFVPLDQFSADLKDQGANTAEIATAYREHLQEVQAHQVHQLAILRALIRHHKLRSVLVEGFTRENSAFVDVRIMLAKEIEQQLPAIHARLAEVKPGTEIHGKIVGLLAEHRRNMLELGSAGRLVVTGELSGVLPLDDADRLKNAKPLRNGRFKMYARANARREAAIVANALRSGRDYPWPWSSVAGGWGEGGVKNLSGQSRSVPHITNTNDNQLCFICSVNKKNCDSVFSNCNRTAYLGIGWIWKNRSPTYLSRRY